MGTWRILRSQSWLNSCVVPIIRHASQLLLSKPPLRGRKKPTLQYDPIQPQLDFTSFGVVPFLQERLNAMLLPLPELTHIPPSRNVSPTLDQRSLLSTLGSDYSLILRGVSGSGKTLAVLVHALNSTFSRVPVYRAVKRKPRVDSVLVVPTDSLVLKYKSLFAQLLESVPVLCCPGELQLSDNEQEYTLSRRPLTIEYLYSDGESQRHCTKSNNTTNEPQIVVTTIGRLSDIVNERRLTDIKLLSIDNADVFLKTSSIDTTKLIKVSGPKSRYVNVLDTCIRRLQDAHLGSFSRERDFRIEKMKTRVDLTSVDSGTEKLRDPITKRELDKDGETDVMLNRRIAKIQRQILYKPIQFCFIGAPESVTKTVLYTKTSLDRKLKREKAALSQGNSAEQLRVSSDDSVDHLAGFVQKTIRFSDDQRTVKSKERPLIKAGYFVPPPDPVARNQVEVSFVLSRMDKSNQVTLRDLIIDEKELQSQVTKLVDQHITVARKNVKNLEKMFLKFNAITNDEFESARTPPEPLLRFLSEIDHIKGPLLIVVPSSVCRRNLCNELNKLTRSDRFHQIELKATVEDFFKDSDVKDSRALLVSASQLIGSQIKNCHNVVVYSVEAILPQSAFGDTCDEILVACINGISDPCDDLLNFYLFKLIRSDPARTRRLYFLINDSGTPKGVTSERKRVELQRLYQAIAYSNIAERAQIKRLIGKSTPLAEAINERYVKTITSSPINGFKLKNAVDR